MNLIKDKDYLTNYFKVPDIDDDHIKHFFFTRNLKNNSNKYTIKFEHPDIIANNKQSLANFFGAKDSNVCLSEQVHGKDIYIVKKNYSSEKQPIADGLITKEKNMILAIRTADCMPILFLDKKNSIIGIAHAGWKGVKAGVIENIVEKLLDLGADKSTLVAILGPCIRQENYEVDQIFLDDFVAADASCIDLFEKTALEGKFLFNLPLYGARKLARLEIKLIDTGLNSFSEEENFLSFRRTTLRKLPSQGNIVSAIMLR